MAENLVNCTKYQTIKLTHYFVYIKDLRPFIETFKTNIVCELVLLILPFMITVSVAESGSEP